MSGAVTGEFVDCCQLKEEIMQLVEIGNAALYHGNCLELLQSIPSDALLVTDQPYGINYKVNSRDKKDASKLKNTKPMTTQARPAIAGDELEFDPAPFLHFEKIAFFGANHCAHRLPRGGRWIVWDKRRDSVPDDHSDCELIWTNAPGADRIHRQKWRGIVREGEENISRQRKCHPNQKPVALMIFILQQLGLRPQETVFDPFMGSGSTGVAALRLGARFVGVESDQTHFHTAVERIKQTVSETAGLLDLL